MNRELIYNILKLSLNESEEVNLDAFSDLDGEVWESVFRFMSMHGVAAIVCRGVERLPQEVRPPKTQLLSFIGADVASKRSYAKLSNLVRKIEDVLKQKGVKCLLLKGLSLAEYYPAPELRKFMDVDLYAPCAEKDVDEAFAERGVEVDCDFYRHSHMSLGGVLVENHHCLLDVRGRKGMAELDADLKEMALAHLDGFDGPGVYFPDARFSLIFNLHHAMSHFIYEGISFKFLADWMCFLRRERELLNTDEIAESLRRHGLLMFAAVMSEVCVKHLGLALDDVPEFVRAEMTVLKPKVVERFVGDLYRPYELIHRKSLVAERLNSVRRIVRSSWKPKVFLGQSAVGFVWDKFVPILMGRKFEAD